MNSSRNFISSLARGLAVIEAFTKEKRFLTLTEISNLTGINKTAIQRLTYTLQQLGYLVRDENKLFRIGPRMLSIGFAVLRSLEIRELAYPYLKELSKKMGQTVNLTILDGAEIVIIERIEVRKIIEYHLQIGSRVPAHCTSAGKVLLAFLPKETRDKTIDKMSFEKMTEYTVTDKEEFIKDLEIIRHKGYALNSQELALGSRTTGAPIFSRDGQVIAAVSISTNAALFTIDQVESEFSPNILERHSQRIKIVSLLIIILTPFLLYVAANTNHQPLIVLFLGLMGGGMLLALFFG